MNISTLSHRYTFRSGRSFNGCRIRERCSSDVSEPNAKALDKLMVKAAPDTESSRVLLYICPGCGDIGCGAGSVRVEKTALGYTWRDIAYENGYEEPRMTAVMIGFSCHLKAVATPLPSEVR